jgi:hypothetical protein
MKSYPEWTNDELWLHEQMNFAAHMAVTFTYLQKHGLSVDDFVRYTANEVIGAWKDEVKTVADRMNAILVNVRANGGEILDASAEGETRATATVTCLLNEELMSALSSPVEVTSKFWDKFIPISAALGMRFKWDPSGERRYHIEVQQ